MKTLTSSCDLSYCYHLRSNLKVLGSWEVKTDMGGQSKHGLERFNVKKGNIH